MTIEKDPIEIVKETKLLGTHITDDLKWDKNTEEIVKSARKRMQLLYKSASFTSNIIDLRNIYFTFIRSILEKSAVVWHSSLSKKNRLTLERVQKAAVKVILKNKYTNYKEGLKTLNIENLDDRRSQLCLKFAKNCLKIDKVKEMFKKRKNIHNMQKRRPKILKKKMQNQRDIKYQLFPIYLNY